ncbi:MAG: GNAT family N-acetyltransferase [Treponema sp.]|nr:GNAT family N-acetyltransferase [Treponema sp.]
MVNLHIKNFDELTVCELHDFLKARVDIFVVEQKCAYQEIDGFDTKAIHVWLEENGKILSYLRILPKGCHFDNVSIGRVISVRRSGGFGKQVLEEGIKVAHEKLNATEIVLEAQVYAQGFYEKSGFVKMSDEYFVDGIPHIMMKRCD